MGCKIKFIDYEVSLPCVYFEKSGEENTRRTLEVSAQRAQKLDIEDIVIATTSGKTGLIALELMAQHNVVVVSHSTGFVKPGFQQMSEEMRRQLEVSGAKVLTCQHALGGVNRAVRKKLGTYELDEIIAYTLRMFGQGTKVAIEIALMAADAGLISISNPCICIGGTGKGADTAILLKPAHAQDFFDLRIMEFLTKPRLP
jgi:hypothetical protein